VDVSGTSRGRSRSSPVWSTDRDLHVLGGAGVGAAHRHLHHRQEPQRRERCGEPADHRGFGFDDLRRQRQDHRDGEHRRREAHALADPLAPTQVEAGGDGGQLQRHGVGPGEPAGLAVRGGDVVDVGERGGSGRAADRQHDERLGDAFDAFTARSVG
jgi:hypothetical protein